MISAYGPLLHRQKACRHRNTSPIRFHRRLQVSWLAGQCVLPTFPVSQWHFRQKTRRLQLRVQPWIRARKLAPCSLLISLENNHGRRYLRSEGLTMGRSGLRPRRPLSKRRGTGTEALSIRVFTMDDLARSSFGWKGRWSPLIVALLVRSHPRVLIPQSSAILLAPRTEINAGPEGVFELGRLEAIVADCIKFSELLDQKSGSMLANPLISMGNPKSCYLESYYFV